ncbi:MAG: prepilin-type N-terminal cleavage/methylation domain-containing protein [Gammaproteobacteria bacterium]|nr:prepilin-type N-terminal cleavage/methylation domain-containing protein [Gammaproteobacteria bacterium]
MQPCVPLSPRFKKGLQRQFGFSLMEMVIVITIMGVISALVGSFLSAGFSSYVAGSRANELVGSTAPVVERLKREMREIRSSSDIASWTGTQLNFIDVNGNTISWQIAGNQLLRNTQVMLSGVNVAAFTYLQADGQSLPAANTDIRLISFTVTVSSGDYIQNSQASVRIRSML